MELSDTLYSYDVSPMQAGMLFHSLDVNRAGVYVQQLVATLKHELDSHAFLRAWSKVVERHDLFRTSFHWGDDGEFAQRVHRNAEVPFLLEDLTGLSDSEQAGRLEFYLEEDRLRGFELGEPPLMRLALFILGNDSHKLVWTYHHALLDGRSRVLILKELFTIYDLLIGGKDVGLDYPRPYHEYITWLKGLDLLKAEGYWRNLLDGFLTPTPLPGADFSGRLDTSGAHAEKVIRLSERATSTLISIAQRNGITLNTMFQGAWALLLGAYSGRDDVVFGATRACRRSSIEGAVSMIGTFINTTPVRVRIKPEFRLLTWLQELRAQHIAVRAFEHTPLACISRWSQVGGDASLFDSIVVFENHSVDSALKTQGREWEKRSFQLLQWSNYPITLAAYLDRELLIRLEYDVKSFDETLAVRLCNDLKRTMEAISEDPGRWLGDLETLSPEESHHIFVEHNDTAVDTGGMLIHELFERHARLTPDTVAVVFQAESLTYSELNQRANRLARYLIEAGVGLEVVIGVCLERSTDMIVGLLGVLKAGAAYAPIDPAYPKQRLEYILKDAAVNIVLTQTSLLKKLPQYMAETICMDRKWEEMEHLSGENLASSVNGGNLSYVIYTSGSTGKPKGVAVSHSSLANLVRWHQQTYGVNRQDRATQIAAIGFDASVWEIWPYLTAGATILIADEDTRNNAEKLIEWLAGESVTMTFIPTPLAESMMDFQWPGDYRMRALLTGGDKLRRYPERNLGVKMFNHYGPTESAVVATSVRQVGEDEQGQEPTIGRPIANTQVYIVGKCLQAAPVGVAGEILIGGEGLARGYLGRPELTAEKFAPDGFSGVRGVRLYRTGDLARYLADGRIAFIGRADDQVKVRGYRIELGEIETALSQHPAIKETALIVRGDRPSDKRLVAYVVKRPGQGRSDNKELRSYLSERLPDHMIPSAFVELERMPLTENGKLDRNRLKSMPDVEPEQCDAGQERAATAVEEIIVGIWRKVLKRKSVGITQNFFELGGHSLLAAQVMVRVRRAFNVEIRLNSLFEKPTVEELAQVVEQMRSSGASSSALTIHRAPRLAIAATLAEKRREENQ